MRNWFWDLSHHFTNDILSTYINGDNHKFNLTENKFLPLILLQAVFIFQCLVDNLDVDNNSILRQSLSSMFSPTGASKKNRLLHLFNAFYKFSIQHLMTIILLEVSQRAW